MVKIRLRILFFARIFGYINTSVGEIKSFIIVTTLLLISQFFIVDLHAVLTNILYDIVLHSNGLLKYFFLGFLFVFSKCL